MTDNQIIILPISLDTPNNPCCELVPIDERIPEEIDVALPIIELEQKELFNGKILDNSSKEIKDNMNHEQKQISDNEALLDELDSYERRMLAPTSKRDIKFMLSNACKVVLYEDLETYDSLDELLAPYQSVVILYPNSIDPDDDENTVGHWCTIFKSTSGDRVEFFDSYGSYIDNNIKLVNDDILDKFHKPHLLEPKLLKLLYESPYCDNVHWNETEYQCSTCDTQTCGLWCVARLKNKHLNEYEFKKIYHDGPLSDPSLPILPDLLVSGLICNLYPEMRV